MAKTRAQLPHLYYPPNMQQTRINNAQNFGGGGFDPLVDISWDVYFNASLITGLADGDPVATWEDASANGNDATQSSGSFRATYETSELNGEPIVRFTGDAYNLASSFYRTTGWTAFHVIKKPASGNILVGLGSDSDQPYSMIAFSDGNIYIANRANRISVSDAATTFDLWTTSNSSGNVLRMWKNGVLQSVSPSSFAFVDSFKYLAYRVAGTTLTTGDIAHVSCADTELATADRQDMENYLGDLYALTITH